MFLGIPCCIGYRFPRSLIILCACPRPLDSSFLLSLYHGMSPHFPSGACREVVTCYQWPASRGMWPHFPSAPQSPLGGLSTTISSRPLSDADLVARWPDHCGVPCLVTGQGSYARSGVILQVRGRTPGQNPHPTRGIKQLLVQCWASVFDGEPTLNQQWLNAWCLLGLNLQCSI